MLSRRTLLAAVLGVLLGAAGAWAFGALDRAMPAPAAPCTADLAPAAPGETADALEAERAAHAATKATQLQSADEAGRALEAERAAHVATKTASAKALEAEREKARNRLEEAEHKIKQAKEQGDWDVAFERKKASDKVAAQAQARQRG